MSYWPRLSTLPSSNWSVAKNTVFQAVVLAVVLIKYAQSPDSATLDTLCWFLFGLAGIHGASKFGDRMTDIDYTQAKAAAQTGRSPAVVATGDSPTITATMPVASPPATPPAVP